MFQRNHVKIGFFLIFYEKPPIIVNRFVFIKGAFVLRIGPFGKKRAEEKALKEAVKAMNACLEKVAEWSQEILYESYYDKINAIYDGLKQIDITNPKPDQLTALSELHLFENLLDSFSENKDELIARCV